MSQIHSNILFEQLEKGKSLPVMEEFYSLQGEGFHTGKAAYFIRIGGCDVGCYWCDVKESWNPDLHPLCAVDDMVKRASETKAMAVVVTGGEPLTHNMDYLCRELKSRGIQTFLETSGSQHFSGLWDWICLSPKIKFPPLPEYYTKANEIKVIIRDTSDFAWAEENALLVNHNCKLYLQPEWSQRKTVLPFMVDFIKENPKWQLSLQSHKYINIP